MRFLTGRVLGEVLFRREHIHEKVLEEDRMGHLPGTHRAPWASVSWAVRSL